MNWFDGLTIGKHPDSNLYYQFDWSDWLDTDTIASYVLTVPTGLTLEAESNTSTVVNMKLSGGTLDEAYTVACQITTATTTEVAVREITIDCGLAPGTVSIGDCGG